jgi:hypothetical protein
VLLQVLIAAMPRGDNIRSIINQEQVGQQLGVQLVVPPSFLRCHAPSQLQASEAPIHVAVWVCWLVPVKGQLLTLLQQHCHCRQLPCGCCPGAVRPDNGWHCSANFVDVVLQCSAAGLDLVHEIQSPCRGVWLEWDSMSVA